MNKPNLTESEQTQILTDAIVRFIETPSIDDSFLKALPQLTNHYQTIGVQLAELFFSWEAQNVKRTQALICQEKTPPLFSETLKILLFDDNPARLHMLNQQLNQQRDMRVVATFRGAHHAVEMCQRWSPDLVVLDVEMPQNGGILATQQIVEHFGNRIPVVLVSARNFPYGVFQAWVAGAKGYLTRTDGLRNLPDRLRTIYRGDFVMNQEIRDTFLRYMHYWTLLTQKQMAVFALSVEGYSREQMEQELKISPPALRQTLYRIRSVLKLKGSPGDDNDTLIRDHFFGNL